MKTIQQYHDDFGESGGRRKFMFAKRHWATVNPTSRSMWRMTKQFTKQQMFVELI